jgi:diadenosine tetraphosphate (Ap4A) HIT family hydrolase
MDSPCPICQRIDLTKRGRNPQLIHEFRHSIFVVGDHQFHRGYCVLQLKEHVREFLDLPPQTAREMFNELVIASRAVQKTFNPWKLNHSCYGNQVPHVHWHIFPRYESDPDHLNHPWLHADEFAKRKIDDETARRIAKQVRQNLGQPI